jgi:hypothetical protein
MRLRDPIHECSTWGVGSSQDLSMKNRREGRKNGKTV